MKKPGSSLGFRVYGLPAIFVILTRHDAAASFHAALDLQDASDCLVVVVRIIRFLTCLDSGFDFHKSHISYSGLLFALWQRTPRTIGFDVSVHRLAPEQAKRNIEIAHRAGKSGERESLVRRPAFSLRQLTPTKNIFHPLEGFRLSFPRV